MLLLIVGGPVDSFKTCHVMFQRACSKRVIQKISRHAGLAVPLHAAFVRRVAGAAVAARWHDADGRHDRRHALKICRRLSTVRARPPRHRVLRYVSREL